MRSAPSLETHSFSPRFLWDSFSLKVYWTQTHRGKAGRYRTHTMRSIIVRSHCLSSASSVWSKAGKREQGLQEASPRARARVQQSQRMERWSPCTESGLCSIWWSFQGLASIRFFPQVLKASTPFYVGDIMALQHDLFQGQTSSWYGWTLKTWC